MVGEPAVCVVGYGARTPLGLNALASSAAVRAGIGAVCEHPFFVDKTGDPIAVAMDGILSPDISGADRFADLAEPAIREALMPLAQAGLDLPALTLRLGLPEDRPGRPPGLERALTGRLRGRRDLGRLQVETVPAGHSAALIALQQAWRDIKSGRSRIGLVGGVDSYLEGETLEWLDERRRLMSASNRSGFVPGEGAAFCLLADTSAARQWGLDILAWVDAVATTTEANTLDSDAVCTGTALTAAIAQATAGLSGAGERVNFTYCDLNGERYRSEEFVFAALRVQAAFDNALDNLTPADCWGDTGAASGSLLMTLAVASGQRGYAKGRRLLVWTSSDGGDRSAALLHLPEPRV